MGLEDPGMYLVYRIQTTSNNIDLYNNTASEERSYVQVKHDPRIYQTGVKYDISNESVLIQYLQYVHNKSVENFSFNLEISGLFKPTLMHKTNFHMQVSLIFCHFFRFSCK